VQLYPTRRTFHVAVAAIGLVTLGAAARLAPVVAFGGAMLLAVAFGRSLARMNIARLRAAGFEMVWAEAQRVHRIARGGSVVLRGELRNRSDEPVRAAGLRAIVSSMLEATVEADVAYLAPHTRTFVRVRVHGKRVGRWGIHGLALEVRGLPFGAEGLYEVPLLFANPLGIEVLPDALAPAATSRRGTRARRLAEVGRKGALRGAGDELRELREHAPGDPFKRIAWKASARRGRLLVREMDREEHEVVWLVVDSSVELWAGKAGHAPLDHMVDDVSAAAMRHLRRGDRVGLIVTASRLRAWIAPETGTAQASVIASALASAASVIDADRSELDEGQIARLVGEHARPLDPLALRGVSARKLDALAARAEQLRAGAPFATRVPFAKTPREQTLRHYLASFGVETPPRLKGERTETEAMILRVLDRIATERPRANVIQVWSPAPENAGALAAPVAVLRRRGVDLRWCLPRLEEALVGDDDVSEGSLAPVIAQAVSLRSHAAREKGERALRRLGVRVVPPHYTVRAGAGTHGDSSLAPDTAAVGGPR
jgi:uncharacterized protein (DUF58 family)